MHQNLQMAGQILHDHNGASLDQAAVRLGVSRHGTLSGQAAALQETIARLYADAGHSGALLPAN